MLLISQAIVNNFSFIFSTIGSGNININRNNNPITTTQQHIKNSNIKNSRNSSSNNNSSGNTVTTTAAISQQQQHRLKGVSVGGSSLNLFSIGSNSVFSNGTTSATSTIASITVTRSVSRNASLILISPPIIIGIPHIISAHLIFHINFFFK
ncbi:hypothetical protein ACTFIU_010967 [Dictyostelium citrinum]